MYYWCKRVYPLNTHDVFFTVSAVIVPKTNNNNNYYYCNGTSVGPVPLVVVVVIFVLGD